MRIDRSTATMASMSRDVPETVERAWAALDSRKVPYTLHWGKVHNTASCNIRERWGCAVDEWIDARRMFLGAGGQAMFTNELLSKCGLHA